MSAPAFLRPLMATSPYLKGVVYGEPSSGKSTLLARLAVGLALRLGDGKPVAFLDSENAASDILPIFEEAGVAVMHADTPDPDAMRAVMKAAREGCFSIVLAESMTHIYEAWVEKRKAELGVSTRPLSPTERGEIKAEWRRIIAAALVSDPVHYLFSARAGAEYESEIDRDTGRRESYQSGNKIRAEGDTGYEVGLVIRMERREVHHAPSGAITVERLAFVEKCRSDSTLDGKLVKPDWTSFSPMVERLLKRAPSSAPSSAVPALPAIFHGSNGAARDQATSKKKLLLEEVAAWLEDAHPGSGKESVKARNGFRAAAFGTMSESYPGTLPLEVLEVKHAALARALCQNGPPASFRAAEDPEWYVERAPRAVAPTTSGALFGEDTDARASASQEGAPGAPAGSEGAGSGGPVPGTTPPVADLPAPAPSPEIENLTAGTGATESLEQAGPGGNPASSPEPVAPSPAPFGGDRGGPECEPCRFCKVLIDLNLVRDEDDGEAYALRAPGFYERVVGPMGEDQEYAFCGESCRDQWLARRAASLAGKSAKAPDPELTPAHGTPKVEACDACGQPLSNGSVIYPKGKLADGRTACARCWLNEQNAPKPKKARTAKSGKPDQPGAPAKNGSSKPRAGRGRRARVSS